MAIDPRIYTKYSGRSADPTSRMGAALAQSSAQKQKNQDRKAEPFSAGMIKTRYKYKLWASLIFVAIALLGAAIRAIIKG